jgi:hypothetical protein
MEVKRSAAPSIVSYLMGLDTRVVRQKSAGGGEPAIAND